jgi:hypothetical protein
MPSAFLISPHFHHRLVDRFFTSGRNIPFAGFTASHCDAASPLNFRLRRLGGLPIDY